MSRDVFFRVGLCRADRIDDPLALANGIEVDESCLHRVAPGRERGLQSAPVGGSLGQAEPALAPQDAGQFLDQMLLGRSPRRVFGGERRDQRAVFFRILPRQHGVARQHAMAQCVEARHLVTAAAGRQNG